MMRDDGRIRENNPNGAIANVTVDKRKITIALKHNGRKWIGQVQMLDFGFGVLNFKYENENEYGKRDSIIGSYEENGQTYDFIFLIPDTNKIYKIEGGLGSLTPIYNYGNEILIRERVRQR